MSEENGLRETINSRSIKKGISTSGGKIPENTLESYGQSWFKEKKKNGGSQNTLNYRK